MRSREPIPNPRTMLPSAKASFDIVFDASQNSVRFLRQRLSNTAFHDVEPTWVLGYARSQRDTRVAPSPPRAIGSTPRLREQQWIRQRVVYPVSWSLGPFKEPRRRGSSAGASNGSLVEPSLSWSSASRCRSVLPMAVCTRSAFFASAARRTRLEGLRAAQAVRPAATAVPELIAWADGAAAVAHHGLVPRQAPG